MSDKSADRKLLGVVIPVYNEEECITEVITSWDSFMQNYIGDKYIILVMDDGSKDKTPQITDALANQFGNLRVVHQKNGGHGNAVLNGYNKILEYNTEWVFQVDSDNQFLPEDFPSLWEERHGSRFILGYRRKRYDDFNRLIITRIVRAFNFILFRCYIPDSNIPYRLIKTDYLSKLLKVLPDQPFAPNIFLSVLACRDGNDTKNIPVTHKERETGQVSIIKLKLLKVCMRSAKELFNFSATINQRLRKLNSEN
ncbi:MAG TPA: glycosyltransferase family 2 protein [Flavipsychrobacter sp.]